MNDKQKKFLILRAEGLSFDKIVKELSVSKPTLIQWGKLFKSDIQDLQFLELRDLKEKYRYDKKSQYEQLLKQLEKFNNGINEADLSEAKIKDLHSIRNDLLLKIEAIEQHTTYKKEDTTVQLNEI